MGHRLSKIYTRTGDQGTTGLGNGERIDKSSHRVEAMGSVDELNSSIGVILAHPLPAAIASCLTDVQHDLFDLGGEICIPGNTMITESYINRLEDKLDQLNADLPYLKEFILPGGTATASFTHLARSICRRTERCLFILSADDEVNTFSLSYVNRLSDLLFVIARVLNRQNAQNNETTWHRDR